MQKYIKGGLCSGTREKEEEEVLEETWITVAKYEGILVNIISTLAHFWDVSFTFSQSQQKPKFLQMPFKGKETLIGNTV